MKKKRFAEEQIISILKEHEAGATAAALSRRLGSASSPSNAGKLKRLHRCVATPRAGAAMRCSVHG